MIEHKGAFLNLEMYVGMCKLTNDSMSLPENFVGQNIIECTLIAVGDTCIWV